MRKKFTIIASMLCFCSFAQNVGINTDTPSAQLDVNGNVKIRTVEAATAANTYDYLVVDPTTKEVQKVNGNFGTNTTIAKVSDSDGLSLLSTALFSGYQKIDFASSVIVINSGNYFSAGNDEYTVPSAGVYEINYYVRYGEGVQASLLAGDVTIAILKTTSAGVNSVLDERIFTGVSLLGLASITITAAEINSLYQFNAGDKISFAIQRDGVSLGLLGSSRAEFVIKKISN